MAGGTVVVNIIGNATQLQSALSAAVGDLEGFAAKAEGVGRRMQAIGKGMTLGLTLPLVGVGAYAFNAAQDFESAFAGVSKTVDATKPQLDTLRQGIIDMSKEVPASTTEIAAVAEAAGQLGVKTEDILGFTRVMIDLGETTNLSADEAATSLAQLANITQMPAESFDRLGATVVDLGNKGASTEADIVSMGLRLAGAGHQVGMSEPQILGFASALASVGIEAEAGGSAMSRTMIDIASAVAQGGTAVQGFADVAGMSADEFSAAFKEDAAGAITEFIGGLQRIHANGGDVLGTLDKLGISEIRQRDAILRLVGAGDLLGDSIKTANDAWVSNTALTEESAKRYETNASKMQILKNELTDAARVLGEALMPIIKDVAGFVADLATEFQNLSPTMQKVIMIAGLVVAAIGPLVYIFGAVAVAIGAIATPVGAVVLAIAAIVAAAIFLWTNWDQVWNWIKDHPAIAAVIAILAAPIAAFVLLIGALKTLWENWDEIWGWIQQAVQDALDFMQPVFDAIGAALGVVQGIAEGFMTVWSSVIWPAIQAAVEIARGIIEAAIAAIGFTIGIVQGIAEFFMSAWQTVWDACGTIVGAAKAVIEPIVAGIGWVVGLVSAAAQGVWDTFSSVWSGLVGLLGPIADGIASVLGPIIGVLGDIIGMARDAVGWLLKLKDLVAGGVGAYNGGPAGDGSPFGAGRTIEGATGGIVRRPTFALIGEAGPEAVVPLDQSPGNSPLSELGGGATVVNVWLDGKLIAQELQGDNDMLRRYRAQAR